MMMMPQKLQQQLQKRTQKQTHQQVAGSHPLNASELLVNTNLSFPCVVFTPD